MSEVFQLSVSQRQIWQQSQGELQHPCKFQWQLTSHKSPIDQELLRQAIHNAIDEQEIFATNIVNVQGMVLPMQMPTESAQVQWWQAQHADETLMSANLLLAQHWQTEQAKVLVSCVQQGNDTWVTFACHPLHVDANSSQILLETTLEHYQALKAGSAIERDEEDILLYIDASEFTYELWESDDAIEGKQFWHKQINALAVNPVLPQALPIAQQDYSAQAPLIRLPLGELTADQQQQLVQQTEHFQVSSQVWLLSAWQSFLTRLLNFSPWTLSCQLSGRHDEELALTCGPIAKLLPWSVQSDESQRFEQVLRQNSQRMDDYETWFEYIDITQHEALANSANQQYRFEFLELPRFEQQEMQAQVSQPASAEPSRDAEVWVSLQVIQRLASEALSDSPELPVIEQVLCFHRSRFTEQSAQILSEYWQTYLNGLLAEPSAKLTQLALLSDSQQQHILQDFNQLPAAKAPFAHVLAWLQDTAAKQPQATALQCSEHSLSYQQLMSLVDAHAAALHSAGIRSGEFVGVCTQRSVLSVVAMIAVWRAGATYVPLDPSYPKERLDYILQHSGTTTVLATPGFNVRFQDTVNCIDVSMDLSAPQEFAAVDLDPQQAAYLIYTSGTTGTPKGTLISHHAFVNHCASVQQYFELTAADNVLLFAPFNFDPSLEQSIPSLVTGASVYVREDAVWTLEQVAQNIAKHQLSVVNFPTAFWHLLAQHWHEHPPQALTKTLRLVISGGDKMLPAMVQLWEQLALGTATPVRLLNAYGPTETTVTASAADKLSDSLQRYQQLPIGRPLPNRRMYLLDEALQPVAIGCVGELFIAGASIASGYLHDPERTAERFLVDPFAEQFGETAQTALMYRTGDRGFYAFDGQIYFVGRNDTQVKIRGYRVEPLEVEQVLTGFSAVQEAAVVVREGAQEDDKSLLACVVVKDKTLSETEHKSSLAKQLGAQLPDYMLPADILLFEQFPLMPNGKLDRNQLAQQVDSKLQRQHSVVLPDTEVEQHLAGIWSELLKQEAISRDDNFLQLGGHSLVAMRLISRITQEFDVTLSLRDVFAAKDLQQMATLVEQQQPSQQTRITALTRQDYTESGLPLSYSQARIWFLHQMGQEQQYHMPGVLKLTGPLNMAAFTQAVNALLNRHESLRMAYQQPEQLDAQAAQFPQVVTDEFVAQRIQEARFTDQALFMGEFREWFSASFALTKGEVIRFLHAEVAGDYYLGVCLHHICTDAMSNNLILSELAEFYTQAVQQGEITWKALPLQYADFAGWQQQQLTDKALQEPIAYWREQLSQYQDLDIQTGRTRPEVFTGRGDRLRREISPSVADALHRMSKTHGVTLFSSWLAIVHGFLSHYSANQEFVLGIPVSERPDPALEQVVGIFLNSLPIYLGAAKPTDTVAERLKHAQQILLDAQTYQNMPFERLVEQLNPARDLSRNPIFQVMVNHVTPLKQVNFADQHGQMQDVPDSVVQFDLMFDLEEGSDGSLHLVLSYNTDLFDYGLMLRMQDNLLTYLQNLVSATESPLNAIELQGPIEQALLQQAQAVAHEQSATAIDFVAQILQVAQKTPQAVAIKDATGRWSYAELLAQSEAIRQQLEAQGIVAGDRVGVAIGRNKQLLAGMLAVLQLGACFVPLDTKSPLSRLNFILEDAQVSLVLHDAELSAEQQRGLVAKQCLDVSQMTTNAANATTTYSTAEISASDLAYIIYTSGSTGKPKGVMIARGSISLFLASFQQVVQLASTDTVLALATVSFDISLFELFMPVMNGAAVAIAETDLSADANRLQDYIEQHQVTLMQATPVTWQMLQLANWQNPSQLRLVSSGEALPNELGNYIARISPWVINAYGPTEASVFTTTKRVQADLPVTIGRPLAGYQVSLLDHTLAPRPLGIVGDLYIAGAGLAQGYVNLPDRTRESFLQPSEHPSLQQTHYASGDLGYWTTDPQIIGDSTIPELCCLGRQDFQVKLRGYRIEIGEIESLLNQHPAIQQAVVLLVASPAPYLLACYIGSDTVTTKELSAYLAEFLPSYMLPSDYVAISQLPLTTSKKLDRPALMQQVLAGQSELSETSEFDWDTATILEQNLAQLWRDLLGNKSFNRSDDFFAVGGHSLLIVMLQNRIRLSLGISCELQQLFVHRQFKQMAQYLAEQQSTFGNQSLQLAAWQIHPENTPEMAALSFEQQGLWLDEQLVGGSSRFNMVFSLRVSGAAADVDANRWLTTLQAIELRHSVLRSQILFVDGRAVQMLTDQPHFAFEIHDCQHLPADAQMACKRTLMDQEFERRVDLSCDPMWRVHLLPMSNHETHLIFNIHHACTDGVSMQILLREVLALFPQTADIDDPAMLAGGGEVLACQYRDFANWQREFAAHGGFANSLSYWQQTLKNLPKFTPLPLDTPRESAQDPEGQLLTLSLDNQLQQAVREAAIQLDVTPYMLFLTAFNVALYVETGKTDICIGSDVANRTQAEVQNLIGFFVNQIPMRNQLNAQHGPLALLASVKQQALSAFAHQQVPFEQLVSHLNFPREAGYSPMFQAKFIMEHPENTCHQVGSLQLEVLEMDKQPARVDLSLAILDRGSHFSANVVFNRALMQEATVKRLMQSFEQVVAALVAQESQSLQQIRQEILVRRKQAQAAHQSAALEKKVAGFKKRASRSPEKS